MKKTLSLILALLLAISCASFVFADDAEEATAEEAEVVAIAEEPAGSPYETAVKFLYDLKVYKGYNENDLGTENDVKRYEMALFVARISTGWVDDDQWEDGDANNSGFTDLAGTPADSYLGAISYASQKGIIEGYGNGKFGPEDGITYQDALTMTVRTLGYEGLSYPWGYIEKAVALGLTKGITGVAYTTKLNRGVVAQIIYNALYAATADGSKLLKDSFDIEGNDVWEKVLLTATSLATYQHDDERTKAGVIGFRRLAADGTPTGATYYVTLETFGFANVQDATVQIGRPYEVIFNYAKDGSVVNVKEVQQILPLNVIDNSADSVKYLKKFTLVDRFTAISVLDITKNENTQGLYKDEFMLMTPGEVFDGTYLFGINWETGDIVAYNSATRGYDTMWYYNPILGEYYRYIIQDAIGSQGKIVVGYEYMTAAEAEALKQAYIDWGVEDEAYGATFAVPDEAAYATLEVYDLTGDGTGDYGFYEEYYFGKINFKAKDYALVKMYGDGGYFYSVGNTSFDWDLSQFVADFNEIWSYEAIKNDYAIWTFNPVTKEFKTLAEFGAYSADAKYYQTNGVLRAYDINKRTATILHDGVLETYNLGNDLLFGSGFQGWKVLNDDGIAVVNYEAQAIYAYELKQLFNQFCHFVVEDGNLLCINLEGNDIYYDLDGEYHGYPDALVVQGYAGIDSVDGMIVIWAWRMTTGKMSQYRICVAESWYNGDYFNYARLQNTAYLETGALLVVRSYDKANDVYYVDIAGAFEEDPQTGARQFIINKDYFDPWGWNGVDWTFDQFGYCYDGGNLLRSGQKTDKYVIVGSYDPDTDFTPITFFQGVPKEDWYIKGGDDSWTFDGNYDFNEWSCRFIIAMNCDDVVGFDTQKNWDYVVCADGTDAVYTAAYDGIKNTDKYYLTGASVYTVRMISLTTGETKYVTATNVNVKSGLVYVALDGQIIPGAKFVLNQDGNFDIRAALEDYYAGNENIMFFTRESDVDGVTLAQCLDGCDNGLGRMIVRKPHGYDYANTFFSMVMLGSKDYQYESGFMTGLNPYIIFIDDNGGIVSVEAATDATVTKRGWTDKSYKDSYIATYLAGHSEDQFFLYNVETQVVTGFAVCYDF